MNLQSLNTNIFHITIYSLFIYIFSGPLVTAGFIASAIYILFSIKNYKLDLKDIGRDILIYLLAAFIAYLCITNIWSIDKSRSFTTSIKASVVILLLYYLWLKIPLLKLNFSDKYIINIFIALNLVILFEHIFNFSITIFFRKLLNYDLNLRGPIDKATFLITMLIPPILVNYYQKTWRYKLLIIIIVINYIIHPMLAASFALIISWIVMLGVIFYGRKFIVLFFSSLVTFIISAPLIYDYILNLPIIIKLLTNLPLSWYYRIIMWQKASLMIKYRAFLGYGLNCSNSTNDLDIFKNEVIIELHPHNMYLQLWLELGAVGVLIFCILLTKIFMDITNNPDKKFQVSACGLVATITVFALISFGMWQSWVLCSIAIAVINLKIFKQNFIYYKPTI
jgi:O-antigen ligase